MIYGNILLLKLIKFHIKQINFDFLILKFGRERSVFHSVFDKIFDKIRGTFKAWFELYDNSSTYLEHLLQQCVNICCPAFLEVEPEQSVFNTLATPIQFYLIGVSFE